MKQQLLEARMDRIKAMAEQAIKSGAHVSALLDIIKLINATQKENQ